MNVEKKFKALLKVDYPTDFIEGTNIPIFEPRHKEEKKRKEQEEDKYDKDFLFVDRYTGLYAFGHILLDLGGAEGLYRAINCALLSNLNCNAKNTILDTGCGVGRMLYDCTDLFPNTFFVGMDYAYNMCRRAKDIVIDGKEISLTEALLPRGFKKSLLVLKETKKAKNVFIAQGSAVSLPFRDNSFDCVVNTYLIDRVDKPKLAISEMVRVLKPGGLFVLSDPLNYEKAKPQRTIPTARKLKEVIESYGVQITESFDGLVYREVKDIRGNYDDFLSFICIGRKH
ncbi:MAG TPA: class I SAM-dependent methyltransferase [Pyrinomonadaceae bacterium]|jgi:ubiquinone/menaquinone biosynthesis C-methylase UbiE